MLLDFWFPSSFHLKLELFAIPSKGDEISFYYVTEKAFENDFDFKFFTEREEYHLKNWVVELVVWSPRFEERNVIHIVLEEINSTRDVIIR